VSDSIDFEGVSFSYGEHRVLDDVSLRIGKGDFVAVLGHNGAGKTTLMKLALGLLHPSEGRVMVLGHDSRKFQRWDKVGYVQQTLEEFDFQFPATVMEVVLMGRLSKKKGLMKSFDKADREAAEKALKVIGIQSIRDKKIGSLSGGQRQKVFLAKTIASEAEVLFLDEPTTAMDYNSQHSFYDLLQKLNKEMGITIILITHDLGQIIQHVKRVVVLNGKIVFDGETAKFDKNMIWDITERV
jgi:zinc transport system ATP-binding protein